MKKLTLYSAVIVTALFFSFKQLAPSTWTLDKTHAKLGFVVTHMMVSDIDGYFNNFDAKINAVNDDFTDASVTMTADVATVNTSNDQRDNHLKSADFFDAAKYPTITFASTSFKKVSDNKYKVTGSLTMHGITKPIVLDASVRTGVNPMSKKMVAGFKIESLIKRSDFNLASTTPGAMISDEITLKVNAEFNK